MIRAAQGAKRKGKVSRILQKTFTLVRRVFREIAFFDLRNIPNKCLVARLHYFMEDDPVCFPILGDTKSEQD